MGKTVLLAIALAAVACNSKSKLDQIGQDQAGSAGSAEIKHGGTMDIAVPVWDEPVADLPKQESFTLIDPGKGDRAELRYQLAPGASSHRAETRLTSRHLAGRTWSDKASLPAIRDGFAITVSDSKQPLSVRPLRAEIEGGPNQAAEAYLKTWRTIENRRFSLPFDERGQLGAISFGDDPAGTRSASAKDDLVQWLLATVVPLPAEPVGVGARWRVVTALRQRPAAVKQTATYTLVARTATSWKIDVEIVRVAEQQTLRDDDTLGKGVALDLVGLLRHYRGTLELDPRHALPNGSLSVDSTLHIRVPGAPSQEQIFEDTGSVKLTPES